MTPHGLGVALATPFTSDHSIDTQALVRLVQHVVGGGADFLVALGSTGEAALLDEAERDHVVATILAHRGHVPTFVGTGAPSTRQAVGWTRRAKALGAAGALVVVPPYTKPTQAGIVAHFAAIAHAVPGFPLIAYNVPSRVGQNLLPATVRELWALPEVVALKESSGDLQQIARVAADLPKGRTLLAGDDGLLLPTLAVGGHGIVSVAGNVVPAAMRSLLAASLAGDLPTARRLNAQLLPLFEALAAEPNPIPIKAALALAGIADDAVRLPLLPAGAATRERLRSTLAAVAEAVHA